MVKIRAYETGDAQNIYQMFAAHTPYQRDAPFWVWINRMLSDEASIVAVAEAEGDLVGHYAIVPRKCSIGGIELNCGLGIHAFVAPNYRNSVSIFSISKHAYDMASQKGFDFLYGFPNANYRLIQERIEKWKRVSLFNAFVKPSHLVVKNDLRFSWNAVSSINADDHFQINELLESKAESENYFQKSLNYYLNRFLHHPQKPYETWLLRKGSICIGAVVVKRFFDKEDRVHIIDYLVTDKACIEEIMSDFECLYADKADVFSIWPTSVELSKVLERKGYEQTGFDTFFGIKLLSDRAKDLEPQILDIKKWELFMSDSDAF